MSKSKGNVVDPWYIIEKYGADASRWYFYTVNQPGDAKLFAERDIDKSLKKFILIFWNSFLFFETYGKNQKSEILNPKSTDVLDRWIVSKLNSLIRSVTGNLDDYDVTSAARIIENFVTEELSQWYIRRSRQRFQKPKTKKELKEASETLGFVLLNLSKLAAPFIPFLSEYLYRNLIKVQSQSSVHLEAWPKANGKLIDLKLEEKVRKIREIVTLALAERAKAGIKVRQPLSELIINNYQLKKERELLELIREEVNVKEISFGKSLKLETKITAELKEEGMIREIIRHIQEMRKTADLKPKDKISVKYLADNEIVEILIKNKKIILEEARVKDLVLKDKSKEIFDAEKEMLVDDKKLWLAIKKIK